MRAVPEFLVYENSEISREKEFLQQEVSRLSNLTERMDLELRVLRRRSTGVFAGAGMQGSPRSPMKYSDSGIASDADSETSKRAAAGQRLFSEEADQVGGNSSRVSHHLLDATLSLSPLSLIVRANSNRFVAHGLDSAGASTCRSCQGNGGKTNSLSENLMNVGRS
jgi:hypothetical protein